jgi:hypothetical protein
VPERGLRAPVSRARILACLVLAAAAAGCLGEEPVLEDSYELVERTALEVDLGVASGDAFRVEASANGTVNWDVHRHANGSIEVLANGTGTEVDTRHTAEADGTHSFLVRNPGDAPLRLEVTVTGTATVEDVRRLI